jgi:hypothetical protein
MNFFEEIETYLTGKLSPTDHQRFESEMAKNADLQQAVADERQLLAWFQADKIQSTTPKRDAQSEASVLDLENYFLDELAKLPDAPVETPQKAAYTEGSKIVTLNPNPEKKTYRRWWAAAASVALVATVSIWLYQRTPKPQPETAGVKPPTVVPPIDTLIKSNAPTPENQIVIKEKGTPQYKPEKKTETQPIVIENTPPPPYVPTTNPEKQVSNDAVLAMLENVANKEFEQISGPSRGASSNSVSKENQTLLDALEAISANKPQVALDLLKNRDDNDARYYRALATLLTDKTKGKQALQALADDAKLERFFRNKIKDLLKKL